MCIGTQHSYPAFCLLIDPRYPLCVPPDLDGDLRAGDGGAALPPGHVLHLASYHLVQGQG